MKKREIKKENEIIKNIVENVKKFYLWRCQGWNNHEKFMENVFQKIKYGEYDYWFHEADGVMGDFCKYMIDKFSYKNARWFDEKAKKSVLAVERKLLLAINNADVVKYAYEHLDEIENNDIKLHICKKMAERE